MKMPFVNSRQRGQTSLEYLLLLAVVAVVVIAGFGPGSLVDKVHNSAQDYYNSVTRVIMGENPQKINGTWCPVTCPTGAGPQNIYRACECPAPAFGGLNCSDPSNPDVSLCGANQTCNGSEVTCSDVACGPCQNGEVCNAQGQCVCPGPDALNCPSIIVNSIPNAACTECECPEGSVISCDGKYCNYCPTNHYLPKPGDPNYHTTTCPSGTKLAGQSEPACASSAPICNAAGQCTCPSGLVCDPSKNWAPNDTCTACLCYPGAKYDPGFGGCDYCPPSNQCTTSNDGSTCSGITCPGNMYCNTGANSCQCPSGDTCWNGAKCVSGQCSCQAGICPAGQECGPDTCGNADGCAKCASGKTCALGRCICEAGLCPAGAECGNDTCGNTNGCGKCASPESCVSGQCVDP